MLPQTLAGAQGLPRAAAALGAPTDMRAPAGDLFKCWQDPLK